MRRLGVAIALVWGCGDDGDASDASTTMMMMGTGMADPSMTPSSGEAGPTGSESEGGPSGTFDGSTGPADGGSGSASSGTAGVEFQVEDKYGREFIQYARVMKTNDVPKLWISADSIDAVPAQGDLPDGTFIIREEGDPEVNWIFIREKRDSVWWQGDFFPDDIGWDTQPEGGSCSPCHPSTEDATFSIAMLRRFRQTGVLQETGCDQPGNTPCPVGTYD